MAKRFIDTDFYKDPFVRSLPSDIKLLYSYIITNCNHAGVWIADLEIASLYLGKKITEQQARKYLKDAFIEIDTWHWVFPSFIEYQYGKLYRNNKAHLAVIGILEKHGLTEMFSIDDSKPETIESLRKRITQRAKTQIFARDFHRCQYCGESDVDLLNVDHIISLNAGGNNEDYNLLTCCVACNSKKSDKDVFEFIKENKIQLLEGASNKIKDACKILQASKEKDKYKDKDKDMKMDKEMYLGGVGEKEKSLHVQMREVFLDEYKRSTGITYSYNGIDGKKINELEKQIRVTIRDKIDGYTDEDVLNTFKILMQNIPQWYRQNCFDLKGIAGNYQKIIAQLNIKYNGANLTDIDRQAAEIIQRGNPYA